VFPDGCATTLQIAENWQLIVSLGHHASPVPPMSAYAWNLSVPLLLAYTGEPEEAIPLVEKGIRLSPSDPRLFIWLPVEIGRRSWALNRNWPTGLTYIVAGLAQLGRMEEARAALTVYRDLRRTDLASWERLVRRLFKDSAAADHLVDGLRKAGFE
jgi:hypothetical protein